MKAAASSGLPLIIVTMAQQCLQSSEHGIGIVDTRLSLAGPFLRQLLHIPALAIPAFQQTKDNTAGAGRA